MTAAEFAGWAIQPGHRTVQGVVEEALAERLGEPVALTVAGRTDAGVHARGQVRQPPGCSGIRRGPERAPAPRRPGAGERACAGRLQRPPRRPLAHLPLPRVRGPGDDRVFERGRALRWRYTLDPGAAARVCGPAAGHARLHRVHPYPNAPHALPPDDHAGGVAGGARRGPRVLDRGGRLPARDGSRRGGHDARRCPPAGWTVEEFGALLDGGHRREAGDSAPAHGLYLESVRRY